MSNTERKSKTMLRIKSWSHKTRTNRKNEYLVYMNINWQKELFFSSNEREDEILINAPRKQTALTSMFSSKFLEQEILSCTVTRVILQN